MEHVSAFLLLGTQGLLPLVLGSYQSLRTPAATKRRRRAARQAAGLIYDDEEEDETLDETLTVADSLLFPVLGSAALLGLWFAIKYVDKKWIDAVFGAYFTGSGVFAVHSTSDALLDAGLRALGARGPVYHLRVSSGITQIFHLPLRRSSLLALAPAAAIPGLYIPLGRPYLLSNVLALCLASTALGLLRLDGFPTAVVLLSLLLVYDIFWVFATPVMVTVAKGLEAPIKLQAPRGAGMAMLGLGDVVVPGLLVALCLRFDMARHALSHPDEDVSPRSAFPKPYFHTALLAWVAGLVATVCAMSYSGAAQPALLYLSPSCILFPLLLAVARGELGLLWAWREEVEEEERDETIEAPSEVAQMARKEAKARAAMEEAEKIADDEVARENGAVGEDDSWMDDGGVASASAVPEKEKKTRRRGKKK